MEAPLLGIHAYYINAKPVYAEFLQDIQNNGGDMSPWEPESDIADGFFAENPWVGIVVQKNPAYIGAAAEYQTQFVVMSDNEKIYPVTAPSTTTFQTAFAAYFGNSPTPQEDSFGASSKKTNMFDVSISYGDVQYQASFLRVVKPQSGATSWSDIVTKYGTVFVDDIRMKELFENNPAKFFEETFYYMGAAIPRFNLPHQMISYLSYTSPYFANYQWIVPTAEDNPVDGNAVTSEPTTLSTLKTGYEICSVVIYTQDQFGNPIETPYTQAAYDSVTGTVTFPAGLTEGTQFNLYFATDGYFDNKITDEMKRILGLAFQLVWENRFSGEWLARAAKITDKSFAPPNEANWTRAQEEKRRWIESSLNDEMWRYEQNCYAQGALNGTGITLI